MTSETYKFCSSNINTELNKQNYLFLSVFIIFVNNFFFFFLVGNKPLRALEQNNAIEEEEKI